MQTDANALVGTLNLCLFYGIGWCSLISIDITFFKNNVAKDLFSNSIQLCITFAWMFFSSYKDSLPVTKPTSSCQANLGNISSLSFTVWRTLIIHCLYIFPFILLVKRLPTTWQWYEDGGVGKTSLLGWSHILMVSLCYPVPTPLFLLECLWLQQQ